MLNPCYTRQRLGVCRRGGEIYFILFYFLVFVNNN